ncbi:MAG: phosphatidate cytidylyltransferase, partial [Rhodothermales bacterium]|nr:phosphatidate cytidylyltransferase [Rhodothermales bacterium]
MSNLTQRVLTALVAAPIVLGLAWVGGWAFAAFIAVVVAAAQWEVYRLSRAAGAHPQRALGLVLGALIVLRPVIDSEVVGAVVVAGLVIMLVRELYRRREGPLFNAAATAFGLVYPALLASYVVDLRVRSAFTLEDPEPFVLTATALLAAWAADTFAYFAGRAFGRHPLFPRVSPKKTWEGLLGGAVGAVLFALGLKALALPSLTWADAAVVGVLSGFFGPLGDLAESLFKRSVGVKDSAAYLPGHGGFL